MQSKLQIRGKEPIDRLIIQYRIERMSKCLAWIGAITSIAWAATSIASIAAIRHFLFIVF
jgi:hypothetical protein